MKYTNFQLVRHLIADLWRDGCKEDALRLFKARHTVRLDKFGWPVGMGL